MYEAGVAIEPSKDKKEKQIAVILFLVLIPLVMWNMHRQSRAKKLREQFMATARRGASEALPQSGSFSPPAPSAAPEAASTPSSELEEYVRTLKWKRDPFILPMVQGGGKAPTIQLKVSGIIYDETRPEATYAIINQEVVRIGDSFHGINVIDIQPNYVRLKKFGEELILYLYQEEKDQ